MCGFVSLCETCLDRKNNNCGKVIPSESCRDERQSAAPCPFRQRKTRSFNRWDYIFHQGEDCEGAFCLSSGLVTIQRVASEGRMIVLRLLRPESFFGSADLLGEGVHRNAAQAVLPSKVCFIPRQQFLAELKGNGGTWRALTAGALRESRDNEDRVFAMGTSDIPGKILDLLWDLAIDSAPNMDGSVTFTLPVRRKDLAAMVGTVPEVLSRALRRLEGSGAARLQGQTVTLAAMRQ